MNDPSVEVSSQDTSQTSADHGRAENLLQETITRSGIWTPRWQLASLHRTLLFTGFAWLVIAVIVLRFTLASVTTDVLAFLAAAVVGFSVRDATGRTEQRARAAAAGATGPTAEADRMRAALLAAPRLTWADLPGCRPQGLDREARYRFVTGPGSSMDVPDRALGPRLARVHDAPIALSTR